MPEICMKTPLVDTSLSLKAERLISLSLFDLVSLAHSCENAAAEVAAFIPVLRPPAAITPSLKEREAEVCGICLTGTRLDRPAPFPI